MDSSLQQQKKFNELKRKIDSMQELAPQKKYLTYNKTKTRQPPGFCFTS
jgi:hypothetical protein